MDIAIAAIAEVRDDAELGVTFHSLCALHRCFRKALRRVKALGPFFCKKQRGVTALNHSQKPIQPQACILSRSIHEHFIADAALAVLQAVLKRVNRWA